MTGFLRCLATATGVLWFNPLRFAPAACVWLSRILNVPRLKPLIGIPADRRILGPHPFHCVGEKYIAAVAEGADAIPVLIPSLGEANLDEILGSVHGILLTGSPSTSSRTATRARRAIPTRGTTRTATPPRCRWFPAWWRPECRCSRSAAASRR